MEIQEQQLPNVGMTEALGEHASNPPDPRTTGEVLVVPDEDVDGGEREFVVSSLEGRIMSQFEMWVRRNAKQEAINIGMEWNQEIGQRALSAYIGDYGAGAYNFDGRHCRNARSDGPGMNYLLWLLLRRCTPDITMEEVEDFWVDNPQGCMTCLRWAEGNSKARRKAGTRTTAPEPTSRSRTTDGPEQRTRTNGSYRSQEESPRTAENPEEMDGPEQRRPKPPARKTLRTIDEG